MELTAALEYDYVNILNQLFSKETLGREMTELDTGFLDLTEASEQDIQNVIKKIKKENERFSYIIELLLNKKNSGK